MNTAVRMTGLARRCMPVHVAGLAFYQYCVLGALASVCALLLFARPSFAESTQDAIPSDGEEITIELVHRDIGLLVIPSVIVGDQVYIRLNDLFRFAGIKVEVADDDIALSGFFISEDAEFELNGEKRTLTYKDNDLPLSKSDAFILKNGAFIRSDIIASVFGLKLQFDFSGMTIQFHCDCALPVIELKKREKVRKNKQAVATAEIAEIKYPLEHSFFSAGALDWSYSSSLRGTTQTQNFSAKGGIQLLGGDAEAYYLGQTDKPIVGRDVKYRWRYGVSESAWLTEVNIGNAITGGVQLADTMIGMQVNNRPREMKSSFSSYEIFDKTEPGWTVELYVNQSLYDYTRADDAGNYSFNIPLGYGSTKITRKFYGAYGEVRIEESTIDVPYTFLQPGTIEYNISGAAPTSQIGSQFDPKSLVGAGDFKLGLTSWATVGGGLEYDPKNVDAPYLPTGSLSMSPFSGLLLSGDYFHENGFKTTFNADAVWGITLGGGYAYAFPDGKPKLGRQIEPSRQIQVAANMPWMNGNLRIQANERPTGDLTGEIVVASTLTFSLLDLPFSFGGDSRVSRDRFTLMHRSATLRGSVGISVLGAYLRPEIFFDAFERRATTANLRLQRSFSNTVFITGSASRDFRTGSLNASIDLRFNLGPMQISSGASSSSTSIPSYNASAQGSVMFDPMSMQIAFSDRSAVSTGGVLIRPFIDENVNLAYDAGEKVIEGMRIQGAGRNATVSNGMIQVTELQPYQSYLLKPDLESLENIALIPKYKSFGVTPPANGFAIIDLPMYIAGQINGYVNFRKEAGTEPAAGVRMLVMRLSDSTLIEMDEDFLTYESGEFFHVGLLPGKYAIAPDAAQLAKLKLEAEPKYREFYLRSIEEGDMIENLNFDIVPATPGSMPLAFGKQAPPTRIDAPLKD